MPANICGLAMMNFYIWAFTSTYIPLQYNSRFLKNRFILFFSLEGSFFSLVFVKPTNHIARRISVTLDRQIDVSNLKKVYFYLVTYIIPRGHSKTVQPCGKGGSQKTHIPP